MALSLLHVFKRTKFVAAQVKIYTTQQDTTEEDQLLRGIYRRFKYLIDSELNYFATTCPVD